MNCAYCNKKIKKENYPKEKWWSMTSRLRKTGRTYCSPECGRKWRSRNLTQYVQSSEGRKWKKENNPMSRIEVRTKVSKILKEKGHKPKVRGGNGTGMTKPQEILYQELKKKNILSIPELPIKTYQKVGSGYPTCYKVDLGIEELKIAIEIDGASHLLLKRQEQDVKKDMFLESLGWKVLRFKNQEVINNLEEVTKNIMSTILE